MWHAVLLKDGWCGAKANRNKQGAEYHFSTTAVLLHYSFDTNVYSPPGLQALPGHGLSASASPRRAGNPAYSQTLQHETQDRYTERAGGGGASYCEPPVVCGCWSGHSWSTCVPLTERQAYQSHSRANKRLATNFSCHQATQRKGCRDTRERLQARNYFFPSAPWIRTVGSTPTPTLFVCSFLHDEWCKLGHGNVDHGALLFVVEPRGKTPSSALFSLSGKPGLRQ